MPAHNRIPARLDRAARAWSRCRRLMARAGVAILAAIAVSLLYLKASGAPLPIRTMIAALAGLGLAALLAMALIAFLYFNSRGGESDE